MKKSDVSLFVTTIVLAAILVACSPAIQQTVIDRQNALGEVQGTSRFAEARQIQEIEAWKDDPGKIVLWYVNFPPGSSNVMVLQCRGVPASSTESLEPNQGVPRYENGGGWGMYWRVPVDGVDVGTDEMAGRDGTYGDPVHFRQCMTVDGAYVDVPAYGVPYITSSVPYTFKPSTVQRDFESEARLLVAEEIIRRGGCVNPTTLEEIPCP